MFFEKNKIINDNIKENEIKYETPEILMIDCEKKVSDNLKDAGFNIEVGSFGKIYKNTDRGNKKKLFFDDKINNIIEKDIIVIDMKQKKTEEIFELTDLNDLEDGMYITTNENQKEINPINIISELNKEEFRKLRRKDSIFIVFSDKEITEKYTITKVENRYITSTNEELSNYKFLPFNIHISNNTYITEKFNIIGEGIFKEIFKNYKGKIFSSCTFDIPNYLMDNTERILENIYGDLIGYFQYFKEDNIKNTLILLPQCENMSLILRNIFIEILPSFYPEMFRDFVKDTWMNKEEYMLPEVKKLIEEKKKLEDEHKIQMDKIDEKIKNKQDENQFVYNIISSNGTGDKLVDNIIKCLEYLEYTKVENWDDETTDDNEEDLHIYRNENEYFIAEVKGVNGPAIEDDCNVIVKYKSRNCAKLKISSIHGIVFVNYHKNVEPNQREELGFTKKEIKDAIRDGYTLVGTYQLFKAIRFCQENIVSKESIRKSLETPGIFTAIPITFENLGKIENILNKVNVICIPLESNEIKINDELLIIEGNNYYKTKIISMMVNDINVEKSKKGDKVGIKIEKDVPKMKSAQIYLVK